MIIGGGLVFLACDGDAATGTPLTLEGTVFRPRGVGRFPLAVISHGAGPAENRRDPRWRPIAQAAWFVERGFVVVVPMRRRYAASDGEWAEDFGSCEDADYFSAGLESAKDLLAAIDYMRARPYVDQRAVLLIGHSAGAVASLALASLAPDRILGVLNFAGGRGSFTDDGGITRYNCSAAALLDTMRRYGRTSTASSADDFLSTLSERE